MSFTNNLKKSLGFDDEFSDLNPVNRGNAYNNYDVQNYGLNISSEFDDDYLEDFTISPEQPFYEIVLMKPKSMDDMDYVFDQVVQEGNPVVLDLIFLQKKGIFHPSSNSRSSYGHLRLCAVIAQYRQDEIYVNCITAHCICPLFSM